MTGSEQRSFQARRDGMRLALGFVEAFCREHGAADNDALRLTLIVEELYTNTIVHGHGGEHESPVRLELAIDSAQITLHYEDSAPAFDPLSYLQQAHPDLGAALDERRVGGMGLPLVAQMVEQFDYAHVDGVNRLRLVLKRGA